MFSVNVCHVFSCLRAPVGALAARSVELCEGYKNRKTKVYFSERGASQTFFPSSRGLWEERECLCLPWLWVCHSSSQWRPLFVWRRKRGDSVSIISGSLIFDMVGDQHFLWLEADFFSVPIPLPLNWHLSLIHSMSSFECSDLPVCFYQLFGFSS